VINRDQILSNQVDPLRSRVAAAIPLLYAQPVSRITRLTIDDVINSDDQMLLRLGAPASPVSQPLADLLLDYLGRRTNMNTATSRDSRWLFPGRRAGQPLHPRVLSALIHDLGVPTTAGRAAIRQHVLDMPAPVVADPRLPPPAWPVTPAPPVPANLPDRPGQTGSLPHPKPDVVQAIFRSDRMAPYRPVVRCGQNEHPMMSMVRVGRCRVLDNGC
jgi:hypothetical protein